MLVLIVDDNLDFCTTMDDIVRSFGYETHTIQDTEETLKYMEKNHRRVGLVLLDIEFGPEAIMNGIDVLEVIRKNYPGIPVIMVTGKGTIETAVKATKLGAINFIEKSILSKDKIREVLSSAMERLDFRSEAKEIQRFLELHGIIGKTKTMIELGDSIIRFGRTDLNVLISGETGTGKKLVAKAMHSVSRRAKYPFVTVDIPNIPKELFQSELFGHNKGSFSGATDTKKGLFQQAHKGTLFLDEIGDLSIDLQSNLFIPIEEKLIRKVGSIETEELDVRFISATDKDLLFAMKESRFREQLYHRLRECEIHIAPLRERAEDIPDIIEYYVLKHNNEFEESKALSPSALQFLQEQEWRGNIRELASVIKVSLQTFQKEQIEVNDLTKIITTSSVSQSDEQHGEISISSGRTLKEDLAEVDKKKIENTLERCDGNVSKAAALLGISRETLHNKVRRYGINTQLYRTKRN
jgi:two-component system, NtrC family, nitrogen regulation response regulator NtrX